MKKIVVISLLALLPVLLKAESPKREFRASWITTVWAIDWPTTYVTSGSTRTQTIQQQKDELVTILDALQSANMNAAFFQVRGFSDVMYQSQYEPWSQYLTGTRGGDPGYDPLAFAITEAHKRGMELHAWINPYRYSTSDATHGTLPTDYYYTHPDWLLASDSYTKILNPGIPAVIQQIKNIVAEIVSGYNVDGIVFDDYFYINGGTTDAADQAQYEAYNPDNLSRADWRRQNVNKMVQSVYDTIQVLKPYVRFGISPAGVAASNADVAGQYGVSASPVGSDWQYNGIYSDPLAWLNEGTIDYISPQIYWTIGSANDYAKLSTWWSDVAAHFGKHIYASHSLSAMTAGGLPASAPATINIDNEDIPVTGLSAIEECAMRGQVAQRATAATNFYGTEIGAQIDCNRNDDRNDAPGSVFYATNKVVQTTGFTDYLKNYKFTRPALTPAISWKNSPNLPLVTNMQYEEGHLLWNCSASNVRYAVYCVPIDSIGTAGCFAKSDYLLGLTYDNVFDVSDPMPTSYTYAVSVVDRYGNESAPMVYGATATSSAAATLVYPANGATNVLLPCYFGWNAVTAADSYCWQLAEDALFEHIVCARETTAPQFFSGLQTNLEENKTYYWRVRTRKANAADTYSEVYSFTGDMFSILYPANGEQSVELTPTITWDDVAQPNALYTIEISTVAKFTESKRVFLDSTATPSITIPEAILSASSTYYVRVNVAYGDVEAMSETVVFTTKDLETPIPEILSPENNAVLSGTDIEVCWKQQNAKGFRVELSTSNTFAPRQTTIKTTDAYTYCCTYEALEAGTYYLRAKALISDIYTEASEVIMVELKENTAVQSVKKDAFECTAYSNGNGTVVLNMQTFTAGEAEIVIFSLTGEQVLRKMCSFEAGKNEFMLKVENPANSLYMLKIQAGNDSKVLKLQIK